jgi:flagellum-specific ATP synthase
MERGLIERPLSVGIRAVDGMLTCGEGQRLVIMAGAGVGKSTMLGMMARGTEADVTVVALIGERSREVKSFVQQELGAEGLSRSVVVSSTSNTSVALRIRAARTATAIAEYFRDKGLRVLLLMDSLTRVCMAQRELGLATGEPPTTRGYPPSAFAIIPQLLERAGPGVGGGSITAYYTALLESDDLGDPIGDAIRAVTDGHIVLSRKLADQGHFPAIDVLQSTSRVMSEVVSLPHRQGAADLRRVLANLSEAEELQTFGAYRRGEVPRFDLAMDFALPLRTYLQQQADEDTRFEVAREAILKMVQHLHAGEQEMGL